MIKIEQITNLYNNKCRIFTIRGVQVMFDRDLAMLYGVTTGRLNEQVKRNVGRFPEQFRFQLSEEERDEVIAKCDNLRPSQELHLNTEAFLRARCR